MLRATLLRRGAADHALLLDIHHIAADGWSMGIVVEEIAALYAAALAGAPSPLPELAVQYADFAVWQRRWLSGEVLERQLAYWREQLADAPALALPTDRPRPARGFRGAVEPFALGAARTAGLAALSRRQGATLFMTLLALFETLLGRYTGQEDVVLGSPIANRNRAETEGLIGFFVNSLVMRGDLTGDPSFVSAARPHPPRRAGRLRAPGPPLRAPGRGAAPGAAAGAEPPLPGGLRPPERAAAQDRAPRPRRSPRSTANSPPPVSTSR